MALSRYIKRCDQQVFLGAQLAGLLWRMGDSKNALRFSNDAVEKVRFIPHRFTATHTLLKAVNQLAFAGMEEVVLASSTKFSPPANTWSLAYLAQRKAFGCEIDKTRSLLKMISTILDADTTNHPMILEIRARMAVSYQWIGDVETANHHAGMAYLIHQGLVAEFGKDNGRYYVVRALAATGRFDEADAAARMISDPRQKAIAYVVLADANILLDRREEGLAYIQAAEKTIDQMDDDQKGFSRVGLAYARARAGLDPKYGEIKNPAHRANAYVHVAQVLLDIRDGVGPGRCQ